MKTHRFAMAALALALTAGPAGAVDMFGDAYKPCGDQNSTPEVEACIDAKLKEWDRRLNKAYAALQKSAEPAQREPLRKAQRLWLQFRDANCAYYGSGEGTIHRIEGGECVRAMTQDRALELEQAGRP